MKDLYKEAVRLIESGEDFSLATIITRDGSAPRGPGAKMIIRNDGSIFGTIGGGLLEAVVMRTAAEVLKTKKARIEEFHLKGNDFSSIDMTCGGDLEVLIDYIDATDRNNIELFQYLASDLKKKESAYLLTIIPSDDIEFLSRKQFILKDDGSWIGIPPFNINDIEPDLSSVLGYKVLKRDNKKRLIIETINIFYTATIFGAGHVGQKIAQLLKFLGFYVIVIDDRNQFANTERFPSADQIRVVKEFNEDASYTDIDEHCFILIVTRGHINDEVVLRRSLKTDAGYIGMIGSKNKRNTIYSNLLNDGYTQKDLDRVHAPIGLSIGAETPEEIAISIAAEIVKIRSEIGS